MALTSVLDIELLLGIGVGLGHWDCGIIALGKLIVGAAIIVAEKATNSSSSLIETGNLVEHIHVLVAEPPNCD